MCYGDNGINKRRIMRKEAKEQIRIIEARTEAYRKATRLLKEATKDQEEVLDGLNEIIKKLN